MRSAWKVRWQDFFTASFFSASGRKESASSITSFNRVVVSMGLPCFFSFITFLAICSAYGSSEFSTSIPFNSSKSSSFKRSAAVSPLEGSRRRSSGPSFLKEKPLSGLSICMEETPRSAKTKSNPPASSATWSIFAKFKCLIVKISGPKPLSVRRFLVFSISMVSTSRAYMWPSPFKQANIWLV